MDLEEFRAILSNSGVDVWEIMDAAISVASTDYARELKHRRDGIVERLYTQQCSNCDLNLNEEQPNGVVQTITKEVDDDCIGGGDSPLTPQSVPQDDEDEDHDPYGGLFDDEQTKILRIKEQLEDRHQTEDAVIELLQTLADMDLTFTGLKETDIGRHVNRLRKHPSNEVKRLVKHLVSKWKDLVDEWVGSKSSHGDLAPATLTDGDSPVVHNVPRSGQSGNHQGPDFGYSPNPHNGSSGSERKNSEPEQRPKAVVPKKAATSSRPAPQSQSRPAMVASASAPPPNRSHKEQNIDPERLASARKRLQENYQEAQNAKKQRTIQVMDIHEIPKPKNGFISKNKGNFQGRHHR
ncbi:probable mediator of RNA polymerase II transcription subunit 26c [Cynara cardunculus var. scolymus]|uniref:probable mediator of RNA polymerase II transcription subunit 26c n=1 Tax=Cynara cardunculus var. scolymus TaxID=59895 RepID=UPI000D62E60A|nr:probable mediator of RNA polymerase II transcription subunit 26c [Cynara cardunculus var. scolymus]XP_024978852.1 probable mediator of RNA polymerase II transcription subunit 26c [Cynara cardunculus var. scolymus]XP_024978853.1 probable mediator of RNA polymerase II transcription subunit 26c [Cynara cardunculus var. scolymus]